MVPPIPDQRFYTKANFFTLRNDQQEGSRHEQKRMSNQDNHMIDPNPIIMSDGGHNSISPVPVNLN
jgi:hypothetical protein